MVMPRNASILTLLILPCLAQFGSAETVLLDFSSASCMPCRQMRPVVEQLKRAGYQVRDISIDRQPQVAARYGVSQVPTFIVVNDNRETSRLTGRTSFSQLKQMLDQGGANILAAQSPGSAAVVSLGESSTPATVSQDLTKPQNGRFVAIADPNPTPQRSTTSPNSIPAATYGQPAPATGSTTDLKKLVEATVKLSVKDPEGSSAGSGTLVDARAGEALVLTCGHIFRSSQGQGSITVTLYQQGPAGAEVRTTTPGNLIHYDLERDLALVSIRPEVPVSPVPIAASRASLAAGGQVVSIGCNTGNNPTAVRSNITTVDRYQGFPNVEVAGAPVQGRSGGGLFNTQGQLIGVCNAADPQGNEGLYASLPSIHAKLDELKLTMVYQPQASPSSTSPQMAATALASQAPPAPQPVQVRGQDAVPQSSAVPPPLAVAPPTATALPETAALAPAERAALQEIAARAANSEVICIIRPHSPEGKSEVITLQSVSPAFVQALTEGPTGSPAATTAVAPAVGILR